MDLSPRQRFLDFVRSPRDSRPVVSPFLPHPDVVGETLAYLGIAVSDDYIEKEIMLSRVLDYEPMFMTDCTGLIFPWALDASRSTETTDCYVLQTTEGEWVRDVSKRLGMWGDESGFPVRDEEDHRKLAAVCASISDRADVIRDYYRNFRSQVGENGVIVIGHPNPSWLGFQIGQQNAFLHWTDFEEIYRQSIQAVYDASLFVMGIAMEEGIDFMSNCTYGLEITSMRLYQEMDMPVLKGYADWTHQRGGLFWYHNCGHTRKLIMNGFYNELGADVIETIAPPASGDNNLAESRRYIDSSICTKGNLDLGLLRDGTPKQIEEAVRTMVDAVRGYPHIFSTADAVLPGTPPENFIAFIKTAREASGR
ncbi:MAG: uroporphyrinogen decarboxylase family protein [Armatimonadota bacterium]